jgi:hypothetical protein
MNSTCVLARRRQHSKGRTKGKVAKFLATSDYISLFYSRDDASHHHRTDADVEHAAKGRTVNGHDLADVLAIDVECGADGLGLKKVNQERKNVRAVGQLTLTV